MLLGSKAIDIKDINASVLTPIATTLNTRLSCVNMPSIPNYSKNKDTLAYSNNYDRTTNLSFRRIRRRPHCRRRDYLVGPACPYSSSY